MASNLIAPLRQDDGSLVTISVLLSRRKRQTDGRDGRSFRLRAKLSFGRPGWKTFKAVSSAPKKSTSCNEVVELGHSDGEFGATFASRVASHVESKAGQGHFVADVSKGLDRELTKSLVSSWCCSYRNVLVRASRTGLQWPTGF